ncbi:putative proteasome-type protease [Thioflavicoccus mobilis 8321]|uniref:Putative proteasome-type protease n=1 Tax=Thioflavicoccus mobilis 8321 TaxID=765912 RepID=L0GS19_9GAMM|nr:proteasome-type protease [Thioflavicoccus mobilis]AGA89538.1 putative proteasome-type protease [Thioflavicoccus mobilis 8321]
MTYCLGLALDEGLVLASDSRTNAGIDYVTTFSKLHVFTPAPDRLFVLLSAGNLATTQEVLNRVRRDLEQPAELGSLLGARYLFEAADYIGRVSLAVQRAHGPALQQSGVSGETTFLLGGQIAGQPHGLYMIYPQGNYFAASPETPYLQIGENKYGKPALDRIASPALSLADGARLCIVSLDATARSNVTVGPPFEVVLYPKDTMALSQRLKLAADVSLLAQMSQSWNAGIRRAFDQLPRFDWELAEPGA